MREIDRQALVSHSAEQMYALVDDVASYPQFLPWCRSVRVVERNDQALVATLQLHKGPLNVRFTTRNLLDPPRSIRITLIEGPFRSLEGAWSFEPVAGGGSRVRLKLRFAFAHALNAWLLDPVFEHMGRTLLDAFVKRAARLHAATPATV